MECLVSILIIVNLFLAFYTWQGRRTLAARIERLEQDLLQFRQGAAILSLDDPPTASFQPIAEPISPPLAAATLTDVDVVPSIVPVPQQPVAAAVPPVSEPAPDLTPSIAAQPRTTLQPVIAARPPQDSLTTQLLGWFQRTSLLVQVGVVVLFFGIAFLLRYAADQGWLSIELRLVGATLLGIALIGVGWRLRIRRRAYALALQGGGIGVLYLTGFAAHRLYAMLPPSLAFALFVGLGVACVILALFNDAPVLAFLAVVGAFSAPILAASDSGDYVALFGYYALINLGIFAIAWFKAWRNLNWVGFLFTLGVGAAWGASSYQPEDFAAVEAFLIFFFVLYTLISLLFSFRQSSRMQGYVDAVLVFGVPLAFFSLQTPLVIDMKHGMAWSALGTGLWYLLLTAILYWRARTVQQLLVESFAFLAVAFLTTSAPLFFDAQTTSFLWAVEGAGLVWVGTRQSRLWSRLAGTLILLGASISTLIYFVADANVEAGLPFLNAIFAGTLILSLSFFVAAYALHRYEDRRYKIEVVLMAGLLLGGFFWWYGGGLLQIGVHAQFDYLIAGAVSFIALSAALMEGLRPRLDWRYLGWPVQWLTATLLPILLWLLFSGNYPLAGGGWYAWPLAFAVHYWALRRHKTEFWRLWGHLSGFWFILVLLTDEAALRVASSSLGEGWMWAMLLGLPTLILWAIWQYAERLPWPFGPNASFYRTTGIAPVGVVLLGLVLFANLNTAASSAPIPYLPLFNPLDLVQGLFLIAVFAWIRRELSSITGDHFLRYAANWGVGILTFVAVNGALARAVHHLDGVPFVWPVLFNSALLQTLFAVVWGISALILMFVANRRRIRQLWFGGAALLAVTVLKLFLVDLSSAETLGRIVSFLAVGLLILLIGYIAPMPPLRQR
ncbi:MAG: DUF2339 domain-containing protein [Caldilineaceae bacterium]|nr:DUF2339 domain-containing protein [Caldilineaceae bacterium]